MTLLRRAVLATAVLLTPYATARPAPAAGRRPPGPAPDASAPDPSAADTSVPYVSGRDGYAAYRIPAVVRTPRGTLLAFAEGRRDGPGDTGDIDLVVRRSADGGRTWGPCGGGRRRERGHPRQPGTRGRPAHRRRRAGQLLQRRRRHRGPDHARRGPARAGPPGVGAAQPRRRPALRRAARDHGLGQARVLALVRHRPRARRGPHPGPVRGTTGRARRPLHAPATRIPRHRPGVPLLHAATAWSATTAAAPGAWASPTTTPTTPTAP